MEFEIILILVILIVVAVAISVTGVLTIKKMKKNKKMILDYEEELKKTNQKIEQNANEFRYDKVFYLSDPISAEKELSYKQRVFINAPSCKIMFVNYDKAETLIVPFEKIINYEIYENGNTTTIGDATGVQYMGIHTTTFRSSTKNVVNDLKLIIRVDDIINPQITYVIVPGSVGGYKCYKEFDGYKKAIADLQEVVSFLEVVKQNNLKAQQ